MKSAGLDQTNLQTASYQLVRNRNSCRTGPNQTDIEKQRFSRGQVIQVLNHYSKPRLVYRATGYSYALRLNEATTARALFIRSDPSVLPILRTPPHRLPKGSELRSQCSSPATRSRQLSSRNC